MVEIMSLKWRLENPERYKESKRLSDIKNKDKIKKRRKGEKYKEIARRATKNTN